MNQLKQPGMEQQAAQQAGQNSMPAVPPKKQGGGQQQQMPFPVAQVPPPAQMGPFQPLQQTNVQLKPLEPQVNPQLMQIVNQLLGS